MIAAGAAAGNVEKGSRAWQQRVRVRNLSSFFGYASSVNAAVKRFTIFISKADELRSIHPYACCYLDDRAAKCGAFDFAVAEQLQTDIIASLQKVLADADKQISNPSISASLANIDAVTLESAQTMQNVHSETDIILAQTKAAFAPEAKWKSIAKMVFNGTLNGAELFYYLTK